MDYLFIINDSPINKSFWQVIDQVGLTTFERYCKVWALLSIDDFT